MLAFVAILCWNKFSSHLFVALVGTDRWKFLRFYQNPITRVICDYLIKPHISILRHPIVQTNLKSAAQRRYEAADASLTSTRAKWGSVQSLRSFPRSPIILRVMFLSTQSKSRQILTEMPPRGILQLGFPVANGQFPTILTLPSSLKNPESLIWSAFSRFEQRSAKVKKLSIL